MSLLSFVSVRFLEDRRVVAAVQAITLLTVIAAMLIDSGEVEGLLIFWAFAFFVPTATLLALVVLRETHTISHPYQLADLQKMRIANVLLLVVVVWFHFTVLHTNVNARVWLVEMSTVSSAAFFILSMQEVPWSELKDVPWKK